MPDTNNVSDSSECVKTLEEEKKIIPIHNGQELLNCDNDQLKSFIELLSPAYDHNRAPLGEDFRNKVKRSEFQVLQHLASRCFYGRIINTIKSKTTQI